MKKNYGYIAFDRLEGEYTIFETREQAVKEAENMLGAYADYAATDGWPEEFEGGGAIGVAKIEVSLVEVGRQNREDHKPEEWEYGSDWDYVVDYQLKGIEDE